MSLEKYPFVSREHGNLVLIIFLTLERRDWKSIKINVEKINGSPSKVRPGGSFIHQRK